MSGVPDTDALNARLTLFELLRRVERIGQRARDAAGPDDEGACPAWLRIEQPAALHFAGTEVVDVRCRPDPAAPLGVPAEVLVRQRPFGLFAPYGPLPIHMTEHAMAELGTTRNPAFEAFVNLVSGHFAWLHYRAWSSLHPVLGYERRRHVFVERVGMLAALMPEHARAEGDPAASQIRRCRAAWPGAYAAPQRPLSVLVRLLRAAFCVGIAIKPRVGRWLKAPPGEWSARRLGEWRLGARLFDAQTSADFIVGPLEAREFTAWQRRSPRVRTLVATAIDYVHGRLRPIVRVLVRVGPDDAARIGSARIGSSAWLRPPPSLRSVTVHYPEDMP